MNHCVPDFETDDDYSIPAASLSFSRPIKSAMGGDEDVMELLWQNGQVVVQSQNQRSVNNNNNNNKKSQSQSHVSGEAAAVDQPREIRSVEETTSAAGLFMQEDEMASWLHYPIDDSSLDRYLYADLLYTPPVSTAPSLPPPASTVTIAARPPIPPLRRVEAESPPAKYQNFCHFSRPKGRMNDSGGPSAKPSTVVDSNETPEAAGGPESRVSPIADSLAQVSGADIGYGGSMSGAGATGTSSAGREYETCDLSVTSSPGTGSGASASAEPSTQRPPPVVTQEDRKRKGRETDETECHSEDVEFEYADVKKAGRGSSSTKRSRAAEVHNLSERRRRDRINEKMKALQELIPRCNKSDKASMLDEAIEYLKSLQMQVQMMSMGCSMVPMMFPGIQHVLPPMAMGMGMGMGMGMNRAIVPYPSVLPGSASAAAAAHLGPRFPVPAFHMPPVPAAGPSRIQATNHSDPMLNTYVQQNSNQPRIPNFADPYQQYLSLQQAQVPIPQNQAVRQPCTNKPSGSKEVANPEHQ